MAPILALTTRFGRRARLGAAAGMLISVLASPSLAASAQSQDMSAAYRVTWAGLPAGDIRLGFQDDGSEYQSEIDIVTEGLPRWLTKFRADAVGTMRITDSGAAIPSRYRARYDLRKRHDSRIDLQYVEHDGGLTAERGAEDTGRKPLLPERFRRDAIDPLSTLAVIRHELRGHRGETRQFTIPVFDGARRFDVVADVISWSTKDQLVRLRLDLRPIAGFKGETSEDGDPDSAPRPVDVTFTNDDKILPVSLRVSIAFLPLEVRLDHVCTSFDKCFNEAR
jgi:hypothetical protein